MPLKIVEFPDPVLRRATRPVTVFDEALKTFVDEMTIVMKDDDGVGIAAPQVEQKRAEVSFGAPHFGQNMENSPSVRFSFQYNGTAVPCQCTRYKNAFLLA
mgnify:CR=1 FL=1